MLWRVSCRDMQRVSFPRPFRRAFYGPVPFGVEGGSLGFAHVGFEAPVGSPEGGDVVRGLPEAPLRCRLGIPLRGRWSLSRRSGRGKEAGFGYCPAWMTTRPPSRTWMFRSWLSSMDMPSSGAASASSASTNLDCPSQNTVTPWVSNMSRLPLAKTRLFCPSRVSSYSATSTGGRVRKPF